MSDLADTKAPKVPIVRGHPFANGNAGRKPGSQAVCEGEISPSEGAAVATLINSYTKAIDTADLVKRMDALEAKVLGVR
jgi:hypothetical protein